MGISSSFSNSNLNFLDAIPTSCSLYQHIRILNRAIALPSQKKRDWETRSPQPRPAGLSFQLFVLSN
ncbi:MULTISPECIES: hypothetical protein [Kamptonema]|uniref:hypothetical protein n=1 Tax=Kamptonema TaxID=1501433 RepID=UPI0002DCDDDC|nr:MULTISPECIES: hypothetical protein [Kamptonema]